MLKPIIDILEYAFDKLNESKFNNELPQAVITIQAKGKVDCFGWCTVEPIWYNNKEETFYEINLSAEYLNRSFYETFGTLLHKMIHLSNAIKGISDCNKKQFHNENFKEEAERVGLLVEKVSQHGWTKTIMTEELKQFCDELKIDTSIFNFARMDKPVRKTIRKNNKVKLICPHCNRKITTDEDSDIQIICGQCNVEFVQIQGKK